MRVERNLEDAKFNSYFPPENRKGRMNQRNQHLSSLRHVGWAVSPSISHEVMGPDAMIFIL